VNKLRVGVILPDVKAPVCVTRMLEGIRDSSHAEVVLLAITGETAKKDGLASQLYRLHFQLDKRFFRPLPNPWEQKDVREFLPKVELLLGNLSGWNSSLKVADLDVLINLGLDHMPESLLDVARYGVWSLRCNDGRATTGTAVGWLELLRDEPLIHCVVDAKLGGSVREIARSVMVADRISFTQIQKSFLWRTASIVPHALKRLHLGGEKEFFAHTEAIESAIEISKPGVGETVALAWKQVTRKLGNKLRRDGSIDRWILLAGIRSSDDPLGWGGLKPIVPPRGAFWADPFIVQRESKIYIFFEEFLHKTGFGRISCVEIGPECCIGEARTVLEKPYHLSYPFIFEYRGELFMIPESAQNRTIEAYRCTRFPDQWEHHKTIMRDLRAVDTTLIEYNGLWWMFVNIAGEGGSTWDELHVFYADEPFSDQWTPHLLNPVISDVRSARPAGRLFLRDGGLVRPSQDSSIRYGYALNLNRITKLTTNEYEEQLVERLEPPSGGDILAVHTCNFSGNLTVIDAMLK